MSELSGTYYDGRSSRGVPVRLSMAGNGCLSVQGEGVALAIHSALRLVGIESAPVPAGGEGEPGL